MECGQWGTIAKTQISIPRSRDKKQNETAEYEPTKTVNLSEIKDKNVARKKTGLGELDRVLGGGLVPGSLILLGGEPGIGKSTLALQLADLLPNSLYLSGEESVEQIKLRADRLKIKNSSLRFGNENSVEKIITTIKKSAPTLAIIDSVQTIVSEEVEGEAGNLNQVRASAVKLLEAAKATATAIILVGQVNKEGTLAGPKTLEHLVDTVLYLEGDRFHQFRILRAAKNRFGSTDEVGIFSMEENGLAEVKNPSAAFLTGREANVPGSAVTCLMEGTRPILLEVQALVTKTNFGYPQRRASGFDLNRLQVLIAVLAKRAGLPLDSYDIFLNVVGGLSADEPAADLAVTMAIASALKNKQLPKNLVSFGEVGLGGEVRSVNQTKKRLEEIKNLGFEFAVMPETKEALKITGLKIAHLKNVQEIVEKIIK